MRPIKPGYETWECTPHLGTLDWIRGAVPTPYGPIHVYMDKDIVRIKSPITGGWLCVNGKRIAIDTTEEVEVKTV